MGALVRQWAPCLKTCRAAASDSAEAEGCRSLQSWRRPRHVRPPRPADWGPASVEVCRSGSGVYAMKRLRSRSEVPGGLLLPLPSGCSMASCGPPAVPLFALHPDRPADGMTCRSGIRMCLFSRDDSPARPSDAAFYLDPYHARPVVKQEGWGSGWTLPVCVRSMSLHAGLAVA